MKPAPYLVTEIAVEAGVFCLAAAGIALADLSVSEGAVTGGAVGGVILIGGAIVNWYLRVRKETMENTSARSAAQEETANAQATRERKARKDALDEWQQTVSDLRSDRALDREELHKLRDEFQQEKMAHAVTKIRLDECAKDRTEMFGRIEALERGAGK